LRTQDDFKAVEAENRLQVVVAPAKHEEEFLKRNSLDFVKKKIKDDEIHQIIQTLETNNYRDTKQKDYLKSIRNYIILKDYLHKRVVCVPQFEPVHIDVVQRDNFNKIKDGLNIANQLQNGLKIRDFLDNKQNNENGKLKMVAESKYKLIFDRFLGHKQDIGVGSAQWRQLTKMPEKCWVCEGLVYSLIFWNQAIGEACVDQIDEMVDEMMISELEQLQEKA